jgi:hypothetical protein
MPDALPQAKRRRQPGSGELSRDIAPKDRTDSGAIYHAPRNEAKTSVERVVIRCERGPDYRVGIGMLLDGKL